jgi:hypothetical protein
MDPLPGEPREHMDALLGFLVPSARQALAQSDGFPPFGASMAIDGELEAVGGDEGPDRPAAAEAFELIRSQLRERAAGGELLVTGICLDVDLTEQAFPRAIRVELEHRYGNPITCLLPYRHAEARYEFGEMVALEGERNTFP